MRKTVCAVFWFGCVLACAAGFAADDEPDYSEQLPRIEPVSPADAIATFQVLDGYRLELAAHEPLVTDPIAAAFDANGRMFIVEMRGYSEDEHKNMGRVVRLEDADGDGRYDTRTVYVDGLSWPTAVACWDGGVFVGVAPDILYCKDVDGDGVAEQREVVFTGFGRGNVQGLLNSFTWGLDNRIHGATSVSGGAVKRPGQADDQAVRLRGRDFAFDPRTMKLEPSSGGAQHGLSFDDWGRKFVCSNSDHLQMVMYEDRYVARNPYLAAAGARVSIAADGGQAAVYRISPVEPWRIVRTRLRVAGEVPGPIEGGGRAAGYFTGSTGVTIYRGDAWPTEHCGLAIIGDVGSNIVHRKRLTEDDPGIGFVGRRIDEGREFVASRDIWFRPVQFANAPDGTLYILDMYREVIEHPRSLPPMIKKHLDLTSGRDRGRVWRIAPPASADAFVQRTHPRLHGLTTAQLVQTLGHTNAWHRETAARLLYERQDKAATPLLREMAQATKDEQANPLGRMHAMWALRGLGALDEQTVLAGLADPHPRVREHAVRLAEAIAAQSPAVAGVIVRQSATDADPRVRYQAAFSLGEFAHEGRVAAMTKLFVRDGASRWMRLALLSSVRDDAGRLLASLLRETAGGEFKPQADWLEPLAEIVGRQRDQAGVTAVAQALPNAAEKDEALASHVEAALNRGIAKARAVLTKPDAPVQPIMQKRTDREAVLKRYRPALRLSGSAERGRTHFRKLCSQCHKAEGEGRELGPSLPAAAARGAEFLLTNLLDPNREVNPQFVNYTAIMNDGRVITGIITAESATSVTLTRAEGMSDTVLRIDIDELMATGLSLMPEGLEQGLTPQDVADLVAYLKALK